MTLSCFAVLCVKLSQSKVPIIPSAWLLLDAVLLCCTFIVLCSYIVSLSVICLFHCLSLANIVSTLPFKATCNSVLATATQDKEKMQINYKWPIIPTIVMQWVDIARCSQWLPTVSAFKTEPDLRATSCLHLLVRCLPCPSQMLLQFSTHSKTLIITSQ